MPCLFGLEADDGSLHGAVGCRGAATQALFLEHYLDEPIEDLIAARVGTSVERADVVEVGNLAARGAGMSRLLIVALMAAARHRGRALGGLHRHAGADQQLPPAPGLRCTAWRRPIRAGWAWIATSGGQNGAPTTTLAW